MRENTKRYPLYQRLLSFAMAALMVFGIIPLGTRAATTAEEYTVEHISTVADDQTIGRPGSVYGDNTHNAGKVTVGKSVHNGAVSLTYGGNKTQTFTPAEHNFIVTSSQAAQVVGLASESAAPVDVVFVLDTSSSMSGGRATSMVTAANNAISSLMAANPYNRIGVVAFSSNAWSDNTVAAEILSALAHYDDVDSNGDGDFSDRNDITAASNHLLWGSSNGTVSNNGSYIIGRGTNAGTRHGVDGGTNIHAGIALAAEMLTNATSTTVQIDGKNVTRMPFLVVLSDGAPTYSSYTSNGSDTKWYDPNMTSEHGPGDAFYVGNGFLAALTAAYYKGVITEKYFGVNASEKNRCYIYTIGVGLGNLKGDEGALAQITMDPDTYFKTGSTNKFYNNNGNNDFYSYWGKYTAANPARFTVQVNSGNNGTTTISVDSINATKNYVNGLNSSGTKMYDGGLAYNDDYYTADQTADINSAFEKALVQIQQQAMSAPTHVEEEHGADFSGYVTYTDPIGEYMEVKKVFGVVADGNYYQGKSFAQYMQNWNNGTTQEFKDQFLKVLKERCRVTGASLTDAQLQSIIAKAVASDKQAYYKSDADYDNSFVWWGKSYTAPGEEDVQIQILDFAEDDSIEYITTAAIPDGADYVCRSYYFYGEAGGTAVNPNHEYLHFVVRVQRSLKAPYQETVVISAPASLLSAEKVLITEKTDANGTKTYTANVTEADPARVVYEVGLRSDINAFNVDEILAEDTAYLDETAVNGGQTVYTNYDAAKGEYYFYTNDWNRAESESSHHRAMTHATFDAAADNAFYTYTKDTPIYTKNGNTYTLYNGTGKPSGTYYYAREVYDWSASTAAGNTHTAVKRTEYILVDIPADSPAVKKGTDSWYITKGAYKASSLSTAVEDVEKDPNRTGTATIVVHPHRTEDANNSHYTVLLGNNGKLTLKAADTKSVSITKPNTPVITDGNGKVVMVGDELTYTIKVINGETTTADAVVTDKVPVGTEYVSSDDGIYDATTGTITWNISDLPAGHYVEVNFTVRVTEAALSGEFGVVTIDNQAYVKLDNGFAYETNITKNPPEGKKVVSTDGTPITGTVDIPDVLVYRIRWHNDSGSTADVTVTDIIPAGTSYVANSASHNGVYDAAAKTVTWTLKNVEAGASGVVSFRVNVNAAAGSTIENGAKIKIGENEPRVTNKTSVTVDKGDLVLSKDVVANGFNAAENQEFTLRITEAGLGMNGKFTMLKNGVAVDDGITFTNGIATVTIKHDDVIEIQGITAGAIISVTEDAKSGFTPDYAPAAGTVTIVKNDDAEVAVTNTYRPNAVQIQLKANKVLNTSFDVDPTTFGFIAQSCDANGVVDTAKQPLSGEVTVSSQSKTAQITFGAETFSATGIYYYLISEINGGVAGVTYAADRYIVQVDVTDDGTGQLKAAEPKLVKKYNGTEFVAAGNSDTLTFTNTYAPKETQLVLTGDKKLTGRDLKDGEFSFVVTENGKDVTYGINDGEGNIIFQAIPYTTVGDHTYTITEVNSGLKGVDYSTAAYTVTVKVEDVDGQLVATPTYPDGGVVFQNTYTPDNVSLTLTGTKELAGRDLTAGEFSFRVTETVDGKTVEVTTGKNDGQGNIVFTAIGYGVADVGEHIYTVTEVKPDLSADPNMYYDPAVYQVKVTVSYDQSTGTLSYTTPEITKDGTAAAIKFSNIQNPGYVDVPVVGKKQTTGNTVPANLSFSFSVVDMDGNLSTGGSAPANGAVSFTNLSYTTTGTYYYWIYETNHAGQTAHGVTYSAQRYLLEVTVTRDAYNKLTAATAYYKAGTVADTNKTAEDYAVEANKIAAPADNVLFRNDYAAKGTANITATKTLEDKTLVTGDFMFKLERLDNNGDVLSTLYASNAADGSISFPTILVDSNDLPSGGTATVRYIMSEVVTDANRLPGVTYSNAKYYLTITFTDDGEGNITNEVKYYSDDTFTTLAQSQATPVFANSYAPEVGTQAVITAKKTLNGRPLQAGEFSFNLYHVTTKNGVETETLVDTAVNAADGTVTFTRNYPAGVLNGADEITTKYVIREVNNNLGGVNYDDSNEGKGYPVTVKIVDNKDGTIGCTVTYTNGTTTSDVVFTNTYEANDTTFKPEATKDLNNRALKNNEFLFVVKDGSGKTVSTGYNKADGTVVFTEIGYDRVGEHIYTISETNGGRDDIGYSDATYYLKVTVTDNLDGTMTADGAYFSNAACTAEYKINASDVVFTNTYKPSSISAKLEATKVLRGHAMKDGSFSFLVYDVTDMTKPVASGGNAAADADQTVAINFSNIGYTFDMLSGEGTSREFVYAISEQATTHGGVEADETTYYAKVVLSHNARTGELTTAVTYHTDITCTDENKIGVPAFVNTYDPADAKVVLQANKTLINKKLEAGEFTFKLEGEDVAQSKTNDVNGVAKFDELTFAAPGVYEYTISEAVSAGWNADLYTLDHAFKVIVTVEDDLRGKLVATVTYHEILADGSYDATVNLGAAEFINRYTAPPATVDLTDSISADKIVKVPDGVTYSPAGFTFKVTDTTGNVIKGWKDGQEVDMIGISDAAGKITFPSFRFTTAGEYHYWITEQPSNVAGMTDDLSIWEVHILVRYNEVTGLLEINSADVKTYLVGRAAAGAAAPEFVNVFEPAAVTLTLEATKLLEGRELKDREFLFYLMEGNTIVAQGYNGVDGKVRFNLTYTAENIGTHAYTIKEVAPENANNGVTYDTKTYVALTVNVSYDTVNKKLVASVGNTPVANGAVVSTGVTVTNKYTVEGTTAQINAHKIVTANRLLKDKEFTFGLMDSEGKVVATAKNDTAGWITFQMPYDKAGTYTYELFEQPGDDESLHYDTNRYKVTVTVTDDLLGQLHAVVEYENGTVPTFVNEYSALPASTVITAQKVLQGNKTLAADDFTFELESEDGVKVTTKNAAGGVVTFGMRYDAAGIYTYTLRELAGEAAGVTYDDAEYTVIVTVTDNLEGSLEATVAYEGLAEGETVPTFVNTYKGKAAAVQITAAKKLTGKTLTADAYSFTLTNKDNTKDVYTVKNDAKGNVVFDLNLTEVGTYTYILAEATGTDANVTYDKNTYTVTVKVTDDLQGNLKAEVAYGTTDAKAPTFENFYTPSAITVVLNGEKSLKGRDMKAEEFSFEVRDAADKVVATAKNTAEGELVFSGIELNAAGKYTFEVCEVKGSVKGMVYDDAKYIVTIEVVNENGVLKATVTEPKGGLVFKNTYKAPDPTNPGTGDEMPLLLLVSLMFASAGAMVMLTTSRKKRHA